MLLVRGGKAWQEVYEDFGLSSCLHRQQESRPFARLHQSQRRPVDEIWQGGAMPSVAEVCAIPPVPVNTQPWLVQKEGQHLKVFRVSGKRGIMSKTLVLYYNRIDMGIFLCYLELCLDHERVSSTRTLAYHDPACTRQYVCAEYTIG